MSLTKTVPNFRVVPSVLADEMHAAMGIGMWKAFKKEISLTHSLTHSLADEMHAVMGIGMWKAFKNEIFTRALS